MRGMLYILISFIPWILYWTLCGIGSYLGIIIPLAISSILLIPQIFKRSFNIMDLVSFLYFSLASLATFAFGLSIFVDESGFLGYLTLFLMAALSIALRRPYTLQVSMRDYPEVYWKDESFIMINNIITASWAFIFALNSLIFLLLSSPLTLILSNSLIALGIFLSFILPVKLPAMRAVSEFRKYDWKVRAGGGDYDVIIVGSGIGGLTCGALLSKRGYRVLVLEQYYQVGGYCSSFRRKGFVFNSGVEDVSGLWEKGPITYLLRELGLKKDDLFVKNSRMFIFRGKAIRADSLEEFIAALSEMFPGERENIERFFYEAERAYEECYREADVYGVPLPAELIVKVFGERKLLDYPREHPHFYDWMGKSFKEKLDEYFRDEGLKELLSALIGYVGTSPDKAPASSALTACVSYYIHGGYFPKGGAGAFAEALAEFIREHGGQVLVNRRVDKIVVRDGRAIGVIAGGNLIRAPIIVSNANAKTTFLELVGEEHLSREFADYIRGLKMSPSCFMVFLGVDMDLSSYPTLIKNLDGSCDIVINSNADRSLAPPGKASVTIIAPANYRDFPERGTDEYLRMKKEIAETLISEADRIIPGIREKIVVQDEATPKTFERYTSMPEGAIYAFDQSIGVKRPYFKTPIRGLYLVGASTFPGGGVEAAVISGIICANDICGWPRP
ncbi:FAD-dependent oxidoreductase [Candidatus Korarchaeum cryptofilum]|uniref:FAD-dependent oxidoreductase n=1 Tax=Candidatus Korarchaeum cryptofilum TaxID=498846 RepID=A0A3R9P9E4_9CREN|nr:NAD(P)/FAD-dependent oxidoreductase [Candidatus Korarchaeum cryptofilum]RSN67748.1 FAD-dependent oxidoreductase [Candidatus Korarchaeum cryptofilum]